MSHAPARPAARRWVPAVAVAIVILLFVGGVAGYALSQHRSISVRVLTGNASVGDHPAAVEVGGWTYGLKGSVPMWIDASGMSHQFGWPACLSDRRGEARPTSTRIRFGAFPVTDPNGLGTREVVWVDCRG
jgi:hypothetical protein